MHAALATLVAAEEIDPATVRPSPLSAVVFTFLLVAVVLLLWSFRRHLRRVDANLGPAKRVPGREQPRGRAASPAATGRAEAAQPAGQPPGSDPETRSAPGASGLGEGDFR